jgi:hypothetical protein
MCVQIVSDYFFCMKQYYLFITNLLIYPIRSIIVDINNKSYYIIDITLKIRNKQKLCYQLNIYFELMREI